MRLDRPQRFVPLAQQPGALFKGAPAPPRPKFAERDDDQEYIALIRQCPCVHCGLDPCREAAHVRMSSGALGKANALGKKPADRWAAPLCSEHHRIAIDAQHKRSERAFWEDIGVNALLLCQALYAKRGDLKAMRGVVFAVIAEREATSQVRGTAEVRGR